MPEPTSGVPRVIPESLGGSALAQLAIAGTHTPWFRHRPKGVAEWGRHVAETSVPFRGGAWLRALDPAFEASGLAAARLARVVAGNGVVVTTGQQAGLFGGPLYTWSKAFSALAFADVLEAALGVPVAPVFWAATDDADFAEASHTWVRTSDGAAHLQLHRAPTSGVPMSEVPLGEMTGLHDVLFASAGSAPDLAWVRRVDASYGDAQATVGGAYVRLLRSALEPLGMAVLDASHAAVRASAHPLLVRALERGSAIDDALRQREEALRAEGYEPQVAHVPGLSLVFSRASGAKSRIALEGGAAGRHANDESLSANVLLRPIVERAIMPTVAYHAGPGELAYFGQVSAVTPILEAAAPLGVPRWSCTVVEPDVARILERCGLTIAELADPHTAEGALARRAVPESVDRALAEAHESVARAGAVLGVAIAADGDLVDPRVIEGARRALDFRLQRLERRITAAAKHREAALMHMLARARGALFPGGTRQERTLNAVPLFARHGAALRDAMLAEARVYGERLLQGTALAAR